MKLNIQKFSRELYLEFEDLPSTNTPLTADNLNLVQEGIQNDIDNFGASFTEKIGDLTNLNTSDKTSLVNAINSTYPIILYNNPEGSNGEITLNDDIENYKYVEIFYRNNDGFYSSRKFYEPSGKKIVLDSYYVAATNIVFKMNYITITGNTVVRNQFIEASKNNMTTNTTTANTYITTIIGYN